MKETYVHSYTSAWAGRIHGWEARFAGVVTVPPQQKDAESSQILLKIIEMIILFVSIYICVCVRSPPFILRFSIHTVYIIVYHVRYTISYHILHHLTSYHHRLYQILY